MNYSSDEDDQPMVFRRNLKVDKVKCSSQPTKPSKESDCEDDKPLSTKISKVSKGDTNHVHKGLVTGPSSLPKPQVKDEDSDDEKPLSSKFRNKLNVGSSMTRNINQQKLGTSASPSPRLRVDGEDSDDNKPLTSMYTNKSSVGSPLTKKVYQNGSASRDNQSRDLVLNKRPADDKRSSVQSSAKKSKLSDSSTSANRKTVPLKAEIKSDDDEDDEEDDDSDDDSEDDDYEDEDEVPISQKIKKPAPSSSKSSCVQQKAVKKNSSSVKQTNRSSKKDVKTSKYSKPSKVLPGSGEGQKWTSLVHCGVIFPPAYKPHGVKMLYKGKPVALTPEQEEVATMFAVMIDTEYMNKPKFKENFWDDWSKILGRNHTIQNLDDCDFKPIYEWHQAEKEKKKQMSNEEKKALKEEKMKLEEKYTWAIVDGVKEKVGNFRVEPPGLFRGRGEHPKMGKLKKRIHPSDITINIGKDAPIPECPIPGERWKEIRHDNTVTWLAYWVDPINSKEFKYVFLAASSSLKGQSDKEKYEKARMLKGYIQGIRNAYTKDFGSKDVTKRQVAVATYLIDKLALRAGNEKDDDEADTVGCCTLKVENVEPSPPNILKFDFLGKDSIRYQNEVEVELPVFKAIQQFRTGKNGSDDLFDKLDTNKLNAHLKELMPGLTAKVFRTYNASFTLDDMLSRETKGRDVAENVVVYQHANKEVAIICNHQRTVSKSHGAQITKLNEKIDELKGIIKELETDLARVKKGKPPLQSSDGKAKRNLNPEALERKIAQANAKIEKMERNKETKEDLKTVALGTSKINYLDPRITVAWCKRHEVPIEKIFTKSLLAKFAWSMDVDPSFRF
uniref:DNA topoisomerase 1 alpha-like n=1 Tax=Erigeron canadensis TaxID=72917 RepID=UPI001CB9B0F1|nr:DNA topoisomerase 1 alpha-like [Erigeron canadensis]